MKYRHVLFSMLLILSAVKLLAADQPIERQLTTLIFNRKTAEAYYEAEYGKLRPQMEAQGYPSSVLDEGKAIIIDSVSRYFADARFSGFWERTLRENFTEAELRQIHEFYSTPTGRKMFGVMMKTWNAQTPKEVEKEYFTEIHNKLSSLFEQFEKSKASPK